MRPVTFWAFPALLVISWAALSQQGDVTKTIPITTGSERSVKELAAIFEGAKAKGDGKVVTAAGAEVPAKKLIQFFEELKNSPEVQGSDKADLVPPPAELEAALENGQTFDPTPMCSINNKVEITKPYDWWFNQVCNEHGMRYEPGCPICKLKDDPLLNKSYNWWYNHVCLEGGDKFDPDSFICNLESDSDFTKPFDWYFKGIHDEEGSEESTARSPDPACNIKVCDEYIHPYKWWQYEICDDESSSESPFCLIKNEDTSNNAPVQQPNQWYHIFYKVFCVPE